MENVVGRWEPIETAPRDGTDVIVAFRDGAVCAAAWCGKPNYWNETGWYLLENLHESYVLHPCDPQWWCEWPIPPTGE